jgi:hypothetical protein
MHGLDRMLQQCGNHIIDGCLCNVLVIIQNEAFINEDSPLFCLVKAA